MAVRLHRLHDAKREVIIYDYVLHEPSFLARMAAKTTWISTSAIDSRYQLIWFSISRRIIGIRESPHFLRFAAGIMWDNFQAIN